MLLVFVLPFFVAFEVFCVSFVAYVLYLSLFERSSLKVSPFISFRNVSIATLVPLVSFLASLYLYQKSFYSSAHQFYDFFADLQVAIMLLGFTTFLGILFLNSVFKVFRW